jgi:hypothetical protein
VTIRETKAAWSASAAQSRNTKGKDGTIYLNEVYQVSWHAGREKKGQTCVSIRKYGEMGAFRRACAIRRQKEQEMYGNVVMSKWAETLSKVWAA